MGYEIINNSVVTPHRLHALVRLVPRLREPTRKDLFDLLQPVAELPRLENQQAAEDVFTDARRCGLIAEREDKVVELLVERRSIEALDGFRSHMQRILLGATDDTADNYLLNIYTAWYAVQDDRVFQLSPKEFEVRFNDEVFPDAEGREFNTTKLNGWRTWAEFLGLGWPMQIGNAPVVIVPDARRRLTSLLLVLLPEGVRAVPFGEFLDLLADHCPELDGGRLYERCLQANRGAAPRDGRLSLMLSSGLRLLHQSGLIELISERDVSARWPLYPAVGHPIREVSHIRRGNAR